jgi:hypothetical protein
MRTVDTEVIQCAFQEYWRQNNSSTSDQDAYALCMAKKLTGPVTCRTENKEIIGGEGWEGSACVCVCVCWEGGGAVDFKFTLSDCQRTANGTEQLRHMYVWLHTRYEHPVLSVTSVL